MSTPTGGGLRTADCVRTTARATTIRRRMQVDEPLCAPCHLTVCHTSSSTVTDCRYVCPPSVSRSMYAPGPTTVGANPPKPPPRPPITNGTPRPPIWLLTGTLAAPDDASRPRSH